MIEWLAWAVATLNENGSAIAALATIFIALFTWRLWVSTDKLWKESKSAAVSAKQSADGAIRTAMPVLFPWVLDMSGLHQLGPAPDGPFTYTARLLVGFDNFGHSPGTIREVRASLFLTEADQIPNVSHDDLATREYAVMIPGDSRAVDARFGALDLQQEFTLNPHELEELHAEARGRFRRFALVGRVIYDDFFGLRHTSRFCIKMRMWRPDEEQIPKVFQVAVGGSRFNGIVSEPIPKPDPLSA